MRGATIHRIENVGLYHGYRAANRRRRKTRAAFQIQSLLRFLNRGARSVFRAPARRFDHLRRLDLRVRSIRQNHQAICKWVLALWWGLQILRVRLMGWETPVPQARRL